MSQFTVIVGNIGTVYAGNRWKDAITSFAEYLRQSKTNYGRAAGEPVALCRDGEPLPRYDHPGTLETEPTHEHD